MIFRNLFSKEGFKKQILPIFIKISRVPSKALAFLVLIDLHIINFSSTFIGLFLLSTSFLLAFFYADPSRMIDTICFFYFSYVFGTIITFYFLFKSSSFEQWCFKELGEDRVKRLVYRSPAMIKIATKATVAVGSILTAAAVIDIVDQHAHQVTTEHQGRTSTSHSLEVRQKADKHVLDMYSDQIAATDDARQQDKLSAERDDLLKGNLDAQIARDAVTEQLRTAPHVTLIEKGLGHLRDNTIVEATGKTIRGIFGR